jgi:hypothetical protein
MCYNISMTNALLERATTPILLQPNPEIAKELIEPVTPVGFWTDETHTKPESLDTQSIPATPGIIWADELQPGSIASEIFDPRAIVWAKQEIKRMKHSEGADRLVELEMKKSQNVFARASRAIIRLVGGDTRLRFTADNRRVNADKFAELKPLYEVRLKQARVERKLANSDKLRRVARSLGALIGLTAAAITLVPIVHEYSQPSDQTQNETAYSNFNTVFDQVMTKNSSATVTETTLAPIVTINRTTLPPKPTYSFKIPTFATSQSPGLEQSIPKTQILDVKPGAPIIGSIMRAKGLTLQNATIAHRTALANGTYNNLKGFNVDPSGNVTLGTGLVDFASI